jgi:hypothetical protein
MHSHAIQFDPSLQLKELYAMERAAANKRAETVRKKLRFASTLMTESTSEEYIPGLQAREESQGQAQEQYKQKESALRKDKELPTSELANGSFSGWA